MKTTILSVHQPIASEKKYLENSLHLHGNDVNYLSIFELKHSHGFSGIIKLIQKSRSNDFILNLKGENTDYLEYILLCFGIFAFKTHYKVLKENKIVHMYFPEIFFRSLGILFYSFVNYINYLKTNILLSALKPSPTTLNFEAVSEIFYLKTNMWFGIKAGGSIGHISGVVNSLVKKFNVKYVTCESPIMIDEKVHIVDLNKSYKIRFAAPYELNQLQLSNMFFKYLKNLKTKPKCIYQRLTIYNYSGALASKLFNIPLIVEYNGSEVWIQKNWSKGLKYPQLAQKIEDFCLGQASRIVTISKVLEDELLDRGIPKSKIVTYPNCIDPKKYDYKNHEIHTREKIRKDLNISNDELVFTFIGTFGAWHGVEFLADAIKVFIDRKNNPNKKFKFLMIGNGVLYNNVVNSLSEERYSKHVIFTGIIPQSEAPDYLYASDVFLSPHIKREGEAFFGSPTKLFEYMAYKKPIIASALYQIKDVFQKPLYLYKKEKPESIDFDGLLFEPNDVEQFVQCLEYCLDEKNNEILSKVGVNSYQNCMQNYTWDTHVDKIINL